MGLGSDETTCKNEFIEAMRQCLEAKKPGLGDNVDKPDVQENLGALGSAVFKILTVYAEAISDSTTDNEFWQWVTDVNTWLSNLRSWQEGIVQSFTDWMPMNPPEEDLKTAILELSDPGPPPSLAPTKLKGKIE